MFLDSEQRRLREVFADPDGRVFPEFVAEMQVAWDIVLDAGWDPSEVRRVNSPGAFREVLLVGPDRTPVFEIFLTIADVAVAVTHRWLVPVPARAGVP